ncbi:hypothetical protein COLO4_04968 [Corchorus olitorius]|uniref:Uncharacterized protein n=1 Tax=Corchorus olitorius TaxID=93759 RepID=A0A1R3KSB1_9ROSI|nr:hypothetical protein COLO4_04968 [Corchorus olitorius]
MHEVLIRVGQDSVSSWVIRFFLAVRIAWATCFVQGVTKNILMD